MAREIINQIKCDTKVICVDFNKEFVSTLTPPPTNIISETKAKEISEKIPSTIVIMLMIYTVIRFYNKPEILTLYFLSSSVIFLGRLSTFTITQTPPVMLESDINRETKCKKTLFHTFGVSFKNTDQICIDNMFSGHAVNSIVPMMMILLYSNYKYEKIAISIIALINSFFVIISRLHYSSDVIVSIFLSITTPLAIKYVFRNKLSVCKK